MEAVLAAIAKLTGIIRKTRGRIRARSEEIAASYRAQRKDAARLRFLNRAIGALDLDGDEPPDVVARLRKLEEERTQIKRRMKLRRKKRLRTITRQRKLAKRLRWAVVKRTKRRKQLRELRKQEWPKWESWMANGADDNVVAGVKDYAAAGVVHFGLATTSMFRAYVIPQSNPGSLHGPNVRPGRAWDGAGPRSKMVDFQRWILSHRTSPNGQLNEMFGPHNDLNFNDGRQVSQVEGTFNENLHDSHDHVGVDPR